MLGSLHLLVTVQTSCCLEADTASCQLVLQGRWTSLGCPMRGVGQQRYGVEKRCQDEALLRTRAATQGQQWELRVEACHGGLLPAQAHLLC